MPKSATEKQVARTQPDTYEIRKNNYHPGLEVVARPTDPFEQQGKDADLTSAVDTLKMFSKGVESYSTLQESQKKDNAEKAKADYMNGKNEKPSGIFNLGAGYDETWKNLDGEARMARARAATDAEVKQNMPSILDSKDPLAEIQKIKDKHYNAQFGNVDPNDYHTFAGASYQHREMEADLIKSYNVAVQEKKHNMEMQNIKDVTDQQLNAVFEDKNVTAAPVEIKRRLASLVPQVTTVSKEQRGTIMVNAALTKVQNILDDKSLELEDKQDRIDAIHAALKLPDKDGVNWYTQLTNGKEYNKKLIEESEEHVVNHIYTEEQRIEHENTKIYQDNMAHYQYQAMKATTDAEVKKFLGVIDTALADGELDSTHAAHLRGILEQRIHTQGYVMTPPENLVNLYNNVLNGKVHASQIGIAVAKGEITAEEGMKMDTNIAMIKARKEELKRANKMVEAQTYQQNVTNNLSQLHDLYHSNTPDSNSKALKGLAIDTFWDYVNAGENPTKAKKLVIQEYGTDPDMFENPYKDAKEAAMDADRMRRNPKLYPPQVFKKRMAAVKVWAYRTGGSTK